MPSFLAVLGVRNDDDGHDYLLYIYISTAGRGCNWSTYSYRHSRHQLPQASLGTFSVMFGDAGKRVFTTVGVLLVMLAVHRTPSASGRIRRICRADWRCRGCIVMIIILPVGDAEDAR